MAYALSVFRHEDSYVAVVVIGFAHRKLFYRIGVVVYEISPIAVVINIGHVVVFLVQKDPRLIILVVIVLEAVSAGSVVAAGVVDLSAGAGLALNRKPLATGNGVIAGCFEVCVVQAGVPAIGGRIVEIRLNVQAAGDDEHNGEDCKYVLILDERSVCLFQDLVFEGLEDDGVKDNHERHYYYGKPFG